MFFLSSKKAEISKASKTRVVCSTKSVVENKSRKFESRIEKNLKRLAKLSYTAEGIALKFGFQTLVEGFRAIHQRAKHGMFLLDVLAQEKTELITFDRKSFKAALVEESYGKKELRIVDSDGSTCFMIEIRSVRLHGPKVIIVSEDGLRSVLSRKQLLELPPEEIEHSLSKKKALEREQALKRVHEENLRYLKRAFRNSRRSSRPKWRSL